MDAIALLKKYFVNQEAFEIVAKHSRMVADKALGIASALNAGIDLTFIEEAALVHDIGVSKIYAPKLNCYGKSPYICHGVLGREILEKEGFPVHAMVCERHIGVGLTEDDIIRQKMPLPVREMCPLSQEEKIICFADLYYSKNPESLSAEKSHEEVRTALKKFGTHKVAIFDQWLSELGKP